MVRYFYYYFAILNKLFYPVLFCFFFFYCFLMLTSLVHMHIYQLYIRIGPTPYPIFKTV